MYLCVYARARVCVLLPNSLTTGSRDVILVVLLVMLLLHKGGLLPVELLSIIMITVLGRNQEGDTKLH